VGEVGAQLRAACSRAAGLQDSRSRRSA